MRQYETLCIIKPDLDDEKVEEQIKTITRIIETSKGKVLASRILGKKRLAYRVNKSRNGIFLLIHHELSKEGLDKLETHFRLSDETIKFQSLRVDTHMALQREFAGESEIFWGDPVRLSSEETSR